MAPRILDPEERARINAQRAALIAETVPAPVARDPNDPAQMTRSELTEAIVRLFRRDLGRRGEDDLREILIGVLEREQARAAADAEFAAVDPNGPSDLQPEPPESLPPPVLADGEPPAEPSPEPAGEPAAPESETPAPDAEAPPPAAPEPAPEPAAVVEPTPADQDGDRRDDSTGQFVEAPATTDPAKMTEEQLRAEIARRGGAALASATKRELRSILASLPEPEAPAAGA